ncbi:hypothetical protein RE628_19890 [Paenibacillus sp. D2_2]|uniref:hypothetical protein n=1 Tax=Paenibacillus sp. D2_2 TaxID=3073092 RepID=UPI002815954D|nr:hypothetical protein [Paenibacillus sp. D2_2]WMT39646.1 hypothetical protein RE628_19890 [Paenibacillus sp. D2_2]
MAQLDPRLMGTFRCRMMNPLYFNKVCRILYAQRLEDLNCHRGCCSLVDQLSDCMGVSVSAAERDNAVQWLMGCGVDPQNSYHRRRMWNMVWGR